MTSVARAFAAVLRSQDDQSLAKLVRSVPGRAECGCSDCIACELAEMRERTGERRRRRERRDWFAVMRERRNDVPTGCDARWPTWALPIAEAATTPMHVGDLLDVGEAVGFSRSKVDEILCFLDNENLIAVDGDIAHITPRGQLFLRTHVVLGDDPCPCDVCDALARDRAAIAAARAAE